MFFYHQRYHIGDFKYAHFEYSMIAKSHRLFYRKNSVKTTFVLAKYTIHKMKGS